MTIKKVTIPEKEYRQLLDENKSLRKLVEQFIESFNKLNPAKGGGTRTAPKKLEAEKVSKMTSKQAERYYTNKLREKYNHDKA